MKNKQLKHQFDYYVILFFLLSFTGWLWEVILFFFTEHAFINRGIYRGPYLPIYGVGGLLICLCLHSLRKNPVKAFLWSMGICSLLEYMTGYLLELKWGVRWWDYSGHFMNLNGRICLMGAVVFGLGGSALICVGLPLYEKIYKKTPEKWRIVLSLLFLAFFVADAAYCAMRPNAGYGISLKTISLFSFY